MRPVSLRLWFIVLLLCGPVATTLGPAFAETPGYATVEQLAAAMLDRLKFDARFTNVRASRTDPAQIDLTRVAGGELRIDVTNLLGRISKLSPAEQDAAIGQFIASFAPPPKAGGFDPARVYANIRPRDYLDQAGGGNLVFEELAGDLIVLYQLDEPGRLRALNRSEVADLGPGELARMASRNLDKQLSGIAEQKIADDISVFFIDENAFLSPALLLSPSFLGYLGDRFPQGYLVAVPRRDFVIVFAKASPDAREIARRAIDLAFQDGQDLSSRLVFEVRDGRLAVADEVGSR